MGSQRLTNQFLRIKRSRQNFGDNQDIKDDLSRSKFLIPVASVLIGSMEVNTPCMGRDLVIPFHNYIFNDSLLCI